MAHFLIDPFNILWILILTAIVLWAIKKRKGAKWTAVAAGIWFLVISTPAVPTLLLNSLEGRFEPIKVDQLSDIQAPYHIVVLGGGHGFDDRLPANALLSLNALGRLNEAIRLHRQLPNSRLILSGFSSSGRTTQAEMLQQTALLLGVAREATVIQPGPGNTWEEARAYANRFGSDYPVILVTSAAHMTRAVESFGAFGIHPVPSPTNYRLKGSFKKKWVGWPSVDNIENFHTAMSEVAGILWYRL